MKFLIDRVYLWMKRKKEREDGGIFDDLFEMLRYHHPKGNIIKGRSRGKDHYFIREDAGRLRELTPPIIYKCNDCGYVKGFANIEVFAHCVEESMVKYSCRVCKRVFYEDMFCEVIPESVLEED